MTFTHTLKFTVIAAFLNGGIASAGSTASAVIENSLQQYPAGSLDRSPALTTPISESLRIDTQDSGTIETTTIMLDPIVPVTDQTTGTFQAAPLKFELQQTSKFNLTKRIFEFELKLGSSTYASFAELKAAITKLPKGTQITWAPGCFRMGGEPLDTHWKEFTALCEQQGIILVVIPSG
jgi:hypothetical protein